MKMQFPVILVAVLLLNTHLFAQINSDPDGVESRYTRISGNVSFPSPNAASLGVYGDFPVRGFTGVPPINVPLYEINSHNFKLPISLSYNSAGIKVSDIASWVGLGWSLNAGGLITRRVVDYPDDSPLGLLYNEYRISDADVVASNNSPNLLVGYNKYSTKTPAQLEEMRRLHVDTEPDIFYFNFNGHAGKFIFDQNGSNNNPTSHKVITVPYQDLKITFSMKFGLVNGVVNMNYIDEFKVIDEDGNQYFFSDKEFTNPVTTSSSFGYPGSPSRFGNTNIYHFSAWYLTKIITIAGENINFSYAPETYNNVSATTCNVVGFPDLPGGGVGLGCDKGPDQMINYGSSYTYQFTNGLRLTNIQGDNFKIVFNPETSYRQDFQNCYGLHSISVYSKDANNSLTFQKDFTFNTSYLTATDDPSAPAELKKRLLLNSITESGSDNSTKPSHNFEYNNDIPLPNRWSKQQDFWGYFNNNNCKSLVPTLYIYPDEFDDQITVYPRVNYSGLNYSITNANRNTSPAASISGTLKKITFPIGGNIQFEFEPHTFNYLGADRVGGGLRLKKSIQYDGVNHSEDIVKEYTYTTTNSAGQPNVSSGVLFNLPVFAYKENMPKYWGSTSIYNSTTYPNQNCTLPYIGSGQTAEFSSTDINYYKYNLQVGEVPNFSLSGYDGTNIGYSQVSESINGNGKTVDSYSIPLKFNQKTDAVFNSNIDYEDIGFGANPPPTYFCDPTQDGYCDGLFSALNPIDYDLPACPDVTNGSMFSDFYNLDVFPHGVTTNPVSPLNIYPYAPKLNYDWNRGLPIAKKIYDNNGVLLKETKNIYQIFTPQNLGPTYVYGLKKGRMTNYRLCWYGSCGVEPRSYDIVNTYPLVGNICKVPFQSITKTYDQTNPASFLQTTKTFYYGGNHLMPVRTETKDSKGEILKEYTSYPLDYTIGIPASDAIANGILNLQAMHVISPVMESYVQRSASDGSNTRTIQGTFIKYNANIPVPQTLYKADIRTSVANFSPIVVNSNTSVIDTRYTPSVQLINYDTKLNLTEAQSANNTSSSYIWDYQLSYPIAEVSNAAVSNCAFTSFEADGKGNWSYTGVPDPDGTAPTGKMIYNLNGSNNIAVSGLNTATKYIVSYWTKNTNAFNISGTISGYPISGRSLNGWKYIEHRIIGQTSVTISGTGSIDELRMYPENAQMTSYTYSPLIGMTSKCDENNRINYYQYDVFNRLVLIRDQDNNIIKKICYNYAGQPENCTLNCSNTIPNWQNTATPLRCQQGNCGNTGYQEQEQKDINPCSSTANQTRWVTAGYNPTACPIINCIALTSTNIGASTGYVASYYNNATGITYNLPVSAVAGLQALGTIPEGTYTLTISTAAPSPPYRTFYSGCGKKSISGTSATFYAVPISSTGCISIKIDAVVQ